MENASFPSRSHGCCKILRTEKKHAGRQEKKQDQQQNRGKQPQQSVIICVLSRSCREMREGNVHLCVTVGVCARVCLRVECGGANGVLIAWQ